MVLVLQAYAPLDRLPPGTERCLIVMACTSPACRTAQRQRF